jgi:hypothetical protein
MSDPAHNEIFQVEKVRTYVRTETEMRKIFYLPYPDNFVFSCHSHVTINVSPYAISHFTVSIYYHFSIHRFY